MEYKIGDVINLRNDAGVFQVELSRKAENGDGCVCPVNHK